MATTAKHRTETRFVIRPMVHADLQQVSQLEQNIFPDPWSLRSFNESLDEERVGAWVTTCRDQVIGYMITLWVEDEIHILNLAVSPNFQRQGLASRMLTTLEDLAVGHGSHNFWLEVRSSNTIAQQFYRRHGFIQIGSRQNYYRNKEDALIMAKSIRDIP
jgi:ribosomal-protein-alanine N-acetyltransferase